MHANDANIVAILFRLIRLGGIGGVCRCRRCLRGDGCILFRLLGRFRRKLWFVLLCLGFCFSYEVVQMYRSEYRSYRCKVNIYSYMLDVMFCFCSYLFILYRTKNERSMLWLWISFGHGEWGTNHGALITIIRFTDAWGSKPHAKFLYITKTPKGVKCVIWIAFLKRFYFSNLSRASFSLAR